MQWVNKYLACKYVDGARGLTEYDCWGLVRQVRAAELGLPLLPVYGHLRNTNPKEFTRAYETVSAGMEECRPEHGAIASVMHGKVCVHVAVVLDNHGVLYVLEINPARGPRFIKHNLWRRDHLRVTYHRDRK